MGAISVADSPWTGNGLCWRALILPQMEGTTLYNAINIEPSRVRGQHLPGASMYTAWVVVPSQWLCPSDGKNGNGLLPVGTPTGQWSGSNSEHDTGEPGHGAASGPRTGLELLRQLRRQLRQPLCRLAVGDSILVEPGPGPAPDRLAGGVGCESKFARVVPWDPSAAGDVRLLRRPVVTLQSVTDGLSNTILVGEVLPYQTADLNFWNFNGSVAGTTIPINWNSNTVNPADPSCYNHWQDYPTGCRFDYTTRPASRVSIRAGRTSSSATARATSSRRASTR